MTDLVDRLAAHRILGPAPREELAWLAAHGTVRHLAENDILIAKGAPVDGMFIVLEGHVALFVDRGAGPRKIIEDRAGDVTGVLPYSRVVSPPGDLRALESTTILVIPREDLPALIRDCPTLTSMLVHKMLDRARLFTSSGLHDEKMVSLGKLSAGLAHELNNPVSAIARNAALLDERLDAAVRAARALDTSTFSEAQIAALDGVRAACTTSDLSGMLSPLAQTEREESIAGWLAQHGVAEDLAGPLAETAMTFDDLERLSRATGGQQLEAVLRFATAEYGVRGLAAEIREAALRIENLVSAIKGFTHMDQAVAAEPVELAPSLNNTITVLQAKARAKSVSIAVHVEANLPHVHAFSGELNQIWANLIDNALDAVPESGRIEVTARHEHHRVVVRVIDSGPGIPPEVRAHIFDPFFTTKRVGQGTGLGLDIVRRLANHNHAEIDVQSEPGRTEFSVSLPVAGGENRTEG